MIIRKTAAVALVAMLSLGGLAYGNGLNLNSLGTRALTMGGAFVGLADDATAAYSGETLEKLRHDFAANNFHIRDLLVEVATLTSLHQ